MLVKNNTTSIIGTHMGKAGGLRELVRLVPGVNDVKLDAWEHLSKIGVVRNLVKAGQIEVLAESGGDEVSLAKMKPAQAIKVVGVTHDMALLDRWAMEEKRKAVLDAIEKQQDALKIEPSGEGEGEQLEEDGDIEGEEPA